MDPITLTLISILLTIFLYVIYQGWKVNQFWKEKGIPHKKPLLFIGNNFQVLWGNMPPGFLQIKLFNEFPNENIIGFYDFMKPTIMVKGVDLIEKILIKDFIHFTDHGLPLDEERNPLDSNLISMTGKRWKAVRNRLSPIFTTGKLKNMYESMTVCGNELLKRMEKCEGQDVELKEILGCFAMDNMGSCGFGIDAGNLAQPDNEFRRMGKQVLQLGFWRFILFLILLNFPSLVKLFNITFSNPRVVKYFSKIIKDTLEYRREKGFQRNDFIQLMMQIQEKGYIEMHTKDAADDYLDIEPSYKLEKFDLTDDQITGHAVAFLTAGFDTTTETMTFTMLELAKNPEIQEKVRAEILREVKNANGSLTYDALKAMAYLEQCIKEALRIYPPAQMLIRNCTKEYTLPNGLTIQPGQQVMISVMQMHHDPKYYPEPEVYRPERFDPDNSLPSCAFIPFGNGPRICIAMRFAMLEMKFCIAKILMNYKITLSPKTEQPISLFARSLLTSTKQKLYFNIEKLDSM